MFVIIKNYGFDWKLASKLEFESIDQAKVYSKDIDGELKIIHKSFLNCLDIIKEIYQNEVNIQ